MNRRFVVVLVSLIMAAGAAFGADSSQTDLSKIDRASPKLPKLQSEHPEYCLLVFGADAHKKVWLVRDGNVLYVDRNGNGDLTEPGERVEADAATSQPEEGIYYFKAGDIRDGELLHKDLRVSWYRVDHLIDQSPEIKKLLDGNPKWRAANIRLDIEIPGQHGEGIGGRIGQRTNGSDENGWLVFAPRPGDAPVVPFDGPWEVTFCDREKWLSGNKHRVDVAIGTPGIGPGSTAFVEYDGIIPRELKPLLKVVYPPTTNQTPVEQTYELGKRCCYIDLYGSVAVPSNISVGKAHVDISLPNWPGVTVGPTQHEVDITPGKREAWELEPVSKRLKDSLEFADKTKATGPDSSVVEIQFSPDGKQLIAGDYPGGTVHVWDVKSKRVLVTIETGKGYRGELQYFIVSPDWRTLFAPTLDRNRKFERVERDGKALNRWTFDDSIRVFDLSTGRLAQSIRARRRVVSIPLRSRGMVRSLLLSKGCLVNTWAPTLA